MRRGSFYSEVPESYYVWYQQAPIIVQNVAIRKKTRFELGISWVTYVAIVGRDSMSTLTMYHDGTHKQIKWNIWGFPEIGVPLVVIHF